METQKPLTRRAFFARLTTALVLAPVALEASKPAHAAPAPVDAGTVNENARAFMASMANHQHTNAISEPSHSHAIFTHEMPPHHHWDYRHSIPFPQHSHSFTDGRKN